MLIELFDKEPIENMLGSCIFEPELVVFLCDRQDATWFKESAVLRLLRRRGLKTKARFYYLNTSSPAEIRRVLLAVMRDYPGCVFDFSGGRDLVLLMAGAHGLARGMPGFFIDIQHGTFINVQHCADLAPRFALPRFTAEDIFTLTGAAIQGSGHYDADELTHSFEDDVLTVWDMVMRNPKAWGDFVSWLQAVCAGTSMATLSVSGRKAMRAGNAGGRYNPTILEHLFKNGMLTEYREGDAEVSLTFKSPLYKKCLLNQGIWLELYGYVTLKRAACFDDVRTSLIVDWDGAGIGPDTTKNEVDIFLVKGVTPVFVSCKMSAPSPLALSEIQLLSAKFGGSGSRTVLLTAALLGNEHKSLQNRAADIGIHLLDRTVMQSGQLPARMAEIAAGKRAKSAPAPSPSPPAGGTKEEA